MRVIVFTAMLGVTDMIRAPFVVDADARYLCFTDDATVALPEPYERIVVPSSAQPGLASRHFKVLAEHPALHEADLTIWHDASFRLLRDLDWARRCLTRTDLVTLRHPRRVRIEEEALAIARYGYVTLDEADAFVGRYRGEGFTDDVLSSTGLMARRRTDAVAAFNRTWWQEVVQWRGRDQGSFDYAAWRRGVSVGYIKGTPRSNPYAAWRVRQMAVAS